MYGANSASLNASVLRRASVRNCMISLQRFAVDLDLDVMVGLRFLASMAEETDIARLHAFGVDQFSLGRFYVALVLADAQPRLVAVVVVEERDYVADEIRIVGHLRDDVGVGPGFFQIVPDQDRVDGIPGLQIDDDALHAL